MISHLYLCQSPFHIALDYVCFPKLYSCGADCLSDFYLLWPWSFPLMFIYNLYINHLLFVEFIFLGWMDCFALSSLKFIAFLFLITSPLTQCHFYSYLPVCPAHGLLLSVLSQSVMQMLKKEGGRGSVLEMMAEHDVLMFLKIYSNEQPGWVVEGCLCSPPFVLFMLLVSVPLTPKVWCLHHHTTVLRNKESFVRAIHLARCCQI